MKVFLPTETDHTLRIFPKEYVTDATLTIRHELKGASTEIALSCTVDGNYLSAPFTYTFKESGSYELTVKKTDKTVIYRGKAYATAQTDTQNYKMTENV